MISSKCISARLLASFLIAWLATPFHILAYTDNGDGTFDTDGSQSDVQAAHDDVDCTSGSCTIIMPSGTFGWTGLTLTKSGIILQGGGTNTTTVQDNRTSGTPVLDFDGTDIRVTGIKFADGTNASDRGSPIIQISATADNFEVDNLHIESSRDRGLYIYGRPGVVHSSAFYMTSEQPIYIKDGAQADGGDTSWANSYTPGSSDAVFIEDNTFEQVTSGSLLGLDSDRGACVVFRYNTIDTHLTMHGTESSQPSRGAQFWEVYENSFTGNGISGGQGVIDIRSGSAYVHNNTFASDEDYDVIFNTYDYRTIDSFGIFGQADGENDFDVNDGSNPADTGTATSGGTLTMTDSGASWTVDQFVEAGNVFILVNENPDGSEQDHSVIVSNTSTTITFLDKKDAGDTAMNFDASDGYTINKILVTLDQPGYIGGGTLNRSTPANPTQTLFPIRAWDNSYDDSTVISINDHFSNANYHHIAAGTHVIFADPIYTTYTYPHPDRSDGGGGGGGGSGVINATTINAVGGTVTIGGS